MQLLIDQNLSPRLASDNRVFAQAFLRDQVVVTVNVGDFMMLAANLDVHPGVIALREAELNAHQQWNRLQAALAFVEQTCGGDLLNKVLEVQAEDRLVLHTIPC